MPVGGGVICRPVIPERGLSGASHLVGLTVEGWHSQTTCTAMPGKLWFPRNRGTNMPEKYTFPYRKDMPRVPSSAGYFFDFRELENQWVLNSIQVPSRPIARLFRENSGFSEILTRTLGTITCASRGWGNLHACHPRTRILGS